MSRDIENHMTIGNDQPPSAREVMNQRLRAKLKPVEPTPKEEHKSEKE